MDKLELQQLVGHMEWADALVWAHLLRHKAAHADEQIRACVHHIHQVQWAYLQLWRNEELSVAEPATFKEISSIKEWCRRYYCELSDFLSTLESSELVREIAFPWADRLVEPWGRAQPVTLAESMVQVASHSTYHRGQANRRLRELGAEPPLTDFVVWIWMGRPAPEWSNVGGG